MSSHRPPACELMPTCRFGRVGALPVRSRVAQNDLFGTVRQRAPQAPLALAPAGTWTLRSGRQRPTRRVGTARRTTGIRDLADGCTANPLRRRRRSDQCHVGGPWGRLPKDPPEEKPGGPPPCEAGPAGSSTNAAADSPQRPGTGISTHAGSQSELTSTRKVRTLSPIGGHCGVPSGGPSERLPTAPTSRCSTRASSTARTSRGSTPWRSRLASLR